MKFQSLLIFIIVSTLLYTCSPKKTNNIIELPNQVTTISKVLHSEYNKSRKSFFPTHEFILEYSDNNQHLECIEQNSEKKFKSKFIIDYNDNKLDKISSKSIYGSPVDYIFNDVGDLISMTILNRKHPSQEVFTYEDRKLVKHEEFDISNPENKKSIYERNYKYNFANNTMQQSTPTHPDLSADYTFNSEGKILTKSEQYKKYSVNYIGDTLTEITRVIGTEYDKEISEIKIWIDPDNKLLKKRTKTNQNENEIINYTYDDANNLIGLNYLLEYPNGTKEMYKYEIGPYQKNTRILPVPWFVNLGPINENHVSDIIKEQLDDQTLNDKMNQKQNFKSLPEYYILHESNDGINWIPFIKVEFTFQNK